MNNLPSISIIIPIYQVENYIISCLESVARQVYSERVEVILVDDCGTDNSIDLARDFINNYRGPFSFMIFSHSSNRGLSAARNTGMKHATGDYLLFVDSDDVLLPQALLNLTAPFLNESFDVIVGGETGVLSRICRGPEILRGLVQGQIPIVAWNKLYRRQMIIDSSILFYDGILYEDELWNFQIAVIAKSLCIIKDHTYTYTVRHGSIMTTKNKEKRVNSLHVVIREMQQCAKGNNLLKERSVCRKIESLRTEILSQFCDEKRHFIREYLFLRQSNMLGWFDYFKMELFHPIKQLRLFHYALPAKLGAIFHFMWF